MLGRRTKRLLEFLSAAIAGILMLASPIWGAETMPNAFTVACDGGRFGHGDSEEAARANLANAPQRSDAYGETFAFDVSKLIARMSWSRSRRGTEWTLSRSGASDLVLYTYREGGVNRWRRFNFATMENLAVATFPSLAPDFGWTVSIQKCRLIG